MTDRPIEMLQYLERGGFGIPDLIELIKMIDHEKEMIKSEMKNDEKNAKKSEEILDKMATGRLNKFFKEICLEEQDFIKDSSLNVKNYVKNAGGEIVSMVRYSVGEGIEKKQENFAEEVAAQMNV